MEVVADSVVVGGGVMGYSAALELAKTGRITVLVEQFPSPHTRGSSTGQTRVTRIATYGSPALTPIMVTALNDWKTIQKQANKQLLMPCPMLCVGIQGGEHVEKMRRSIRNGGNSPLECTVEEVNAAIGTNFGSHNEVFMDSDAGILMADQCILTLQKLFQLHGGKVMDMWPVTRVEPGSSTVTVHGPRGSVRANRAVICAGPWTGILLKGLGINLPLTPVKTGVYYWRKKVPDSFTGPLFIAAVDNDDHNYYGLPSVEYPGLLKICPHVGVPCDPNHRDTVDLTPILKSTCNFVRKNFPRLEPEPAIVESCIYTMTPDSEMVLDSPVGCPNIAYGCGFSGTGFKLAPTVGRLLRQMVTGQQLEFNITSFAASRFSAAKY